MTSQKAAAPAPMPRILVPSCSLHRLRGLHRPQLTSSSSLSWPSSHGPHRMASLCLAGGGCSVDSRRPRPRHPRPVSLRQLLTSSPSWSSSLSWPSSHGPQRMAVVAWLHCAWQGEGARLTSQKAAAPAPTPRILVPSCSLHRLHGLHRSHGLHRMALIAWLHRAWKGEGARMTSQKAAVSLSQAARMASSCLAGGGCSVD